jgi:hypothetical protein
VFIEPLLSNALSKSITSPSLRLFIPNSLTVHHHSFPPEAELATSLSYDLVPVLVWCKQTVQVIYRYRHHITPSRQTGQWPVAPTEAPPPQQWPGRRMNRRQTDLTTTTSKRTTTTSQQLWDQPDEMLTHSKDNTNNIAEDGISTNQQGHEWSDNTPQTISAVTYHNNTVPTHSKLHMQSIQKNMELFSKLQTVLQ